MASTKLILEGDRIRFLKVHEPEDVEDEELKQEETMKQVMDEVESNDEVKAELVITFILIVLSLNIVNVLAMSLSRSSLLYVLLKLTNFAFRAIEEKIEKEDIAIQVNNKISVAFTGDTDNLPVSADSEVIDKIASAVDEFCLPHNFI